MLLQEDYLKKLYITKFNSYCELIFNIEGLSKLTNTVNKVLSLEYTEHNIIR